MHGCGDALSGALMNAGPIIHPPLMVMNAAPLQHFERWDIHAEGTQPAVRAVTDRLDHERIAVREALGYAAPHYPLADHYTNDRWMYGDAHKQLVKSGDWREHIDLHTHRYVTEDTELGLAFLASVARWRGVDAPIAHGLLAIVGGFLGRDLRRGPRTLEALGLAGARPRRAAAAPARRRLTHDRCAALRRRRRRPHGPRHRDRLRLRRPPRSRSSTCGSATPPPGSALRDEARAEIRASLGEPRRSSARCDAAQVDAIAARVALVDAGRRAGGARRRRARVRGRARDARGQARGASTQIGRHCRADAILTSTTSSILVTAARAAGRRARSASSTCTG